jgi:hypothetical protein
MISYLDVFPRLIVACPSFDGSIHGSAADEDDGEYIRIGQFANHLIQLLDDGDTGSFPGVFAVVDQVLEEGDDEARSLITEGFFDDLANHTFYGTTDRRPHDFESWLGPRARQLPAARPLL